MAVIGRGRSGGWSDPRVKPAFGAAEIDWSHPLASKMKFLWLFNEGGGLPYNLVSGSTEGAAFTSGVSWAVSADGMGLSIANDGDYVSLSSLALGNANLSAYGRGRLLDISSGRSFFRTGIIGGGVDIHAFGPASSTFWAWKLLDVEAQYVAFEATAGHVYSAGAAHTRGVGTNFHIKNLTTGGVGIGTALSASTPISSSVLPLLGAGSLSPPGAWRSGLSLLALYDRVLSDGEFAWLHVEPYAMLRPIIRRRYFVPTPPGPDTLIGDGAAVAMAQSGKGIGVYISEQRPRG